MSSTDDTQLPKRRKFDIATIESPMWYLYARVAREPFKATVSASVQNAFPVASQARRCPEAESFDPCPIQDRESFPFSHDCVVKYFASSRANEVSFRATVNRRPISVPPPLDLVTKSVEAAGKLGGLGFDRCPAGKAADAKCWQGWYGPGINTRADSDVSLACHDGSCEPFSNQETQCVVAMSPHHTAVRNNSRVQNRLTNAKNARPATSLHFPACGPGVVLALDPAREEGGDSCSAKEETVTAHDEAAVQSQSLPPVWRRSRGWPGPVRWNTKADKGYQPSTLLTLRKIYENPGGDQKRSWNLGHQQALQLPLYSVPRRVPLKVSFASSLRFLIRPFTVYCQASSISHISMPTCISYVYHLFCSSSFHQQFTYLSSCSGTSRFWATNGNT